MAIISLTPHLRHIAPIAPAACEGETVGQVLNNLCRAHPGLTGYLLDEQGRLRKHIAIFIEGVQLRGAQALAHRVRPDTEVFVFQALSGG